MASKIKVDQIEGSTSTTVALPSGQTLDLSSGSVTLPDNAVDLSTAKVTGTIPVAKGGTGLTSLGTAGQVVQVNSGASALEFAAPSTGKLIGMEKVYFSDTEVSFSQSGTLLTGSTYYPDYGKISGTYNKQQSNSHILMKVHYCLGHSSTNFHGTVAWVTGKESAYRNMGYDARVFGWYHDEASVGAFVMTDNIWWNGASSSEVQGTGNMTFNYAGAVSGTRNHAHKLNFNPYVNNTDTPNRHTHSEIVIMEYEA